MFSLEAPPLRPIPVITRRVPDELLSSWLTRCAHYYKTSPQQLIRHMGIVWSTLPGHHVSSICIERGLDFRPPLSIAKRIAWCLHVRATTIIEHTHPVRLGDVNTESLVKIGGTSLPCRHCQRAFAAGECPPRLKSWFEPWRIQCGRCLRPYNFGNQARSARKDYQLYGPQRVPPRLWQDALRGSTIVDRWLHRAPCGLIPPLWVVRLLKQPLAGSRTGRNERLLSVLVPEAAAGIFRPSRASGDLSASALPHRISFLAGLARFNDAPTHTLGEFEARATPAGRRNINDILNALPTIIATELRGNRPSSRENGALTVLAHLTSLKLAANLRQVEDACLKLRANRTPMTPESHL